jgi:ribonucleoside-diphosphate reductase alpha chain
MEESYDASIELAKERGSFPAYNFEGYSKSKFFEGLSEKIQKKIADNGIRNVTLNTIAPVGTVSIVAETSSGIEPVFAFWYDRFVKQDDGDSRKKYRVYERIFREFKKLGIFAADNQLPEYMVTSHQIDPYFRIKMQSIWQRYCDNAISSTVNLPKETSVETVQKIYEYAYEMGLKGITVYREGSREGVLVTDAAKEEEYVGHPPVVGGGTTYKVPIRTDSNLYVTIHPREDNEQLPYCIFINSNNMEINARTMGLAILLSSVFQTTRQEMLRKRIDEILSNFKNIEDSSVGAWYEGKVSRTCYFNNS